MLQQLSRPTGRDQTQVKRSSGNWTEFVHLTPASRGTGNSTITVRHRAASARPGEWRPDGGVALCRLLAVADTHEEAWHTAAQSMAFRRQLAG